MIYRMVNGQRVPRCGVVDLPNQPNQPCVLDTDHDGDHISASGHTWPRTLPQPDAVTDLLDSVNAALDRLDTWTTTAGRVVEALEETVIVWQRVFERSGDE